MSRSSEMNYTLLLTLFLALAVVRISAADSEVSGTTKTGGETKNLEGSKENGNGSGKAVVDSENKGKDQVVGASKEKAVDNNAVDPDKKDSSKQLESHEGGNEQKKTSDSVSGNGDDKKEKAREGLDSKPKEGTLSVPLVRKEGSRGEECDSSSNICTIEEKALVACLRVPGNESPDLSLLIQNKGKGTVSVSISAPTFVQLEKRQIELQEKENKKVKVSIGNRGTGNKIILKAGKGSCSLDFRDQITQGSSNDSASTSQFAYINFLKSTPSFWFIILAVLLVIASVGIFISFRWKHSSKNSSTYEKLEMELPVSVDSKIESNSNDGWDDSWDDNWDDEEAPNTPSIPVTPSLSSKGIASRRINKEGLKY